MDCTCANAARSPRPGTPLNDGEVASPQPAFCLGIRSSLRQRVWSPGPAIRAVIGSHSPHPSPISLQEEQVSLLPAAPAVLPGENAGERSFRHYTWQLRFPGSLGTPEAQSVPKAVLRQASRPRGSGLEQYRPDPTPRAHTENTATRGHSAAVPSVPRGAGQRQPPARFTQSL